ncbi:MFS transporter [Mucilaginibacter sp. cycad4]|uniref:MFS transporter n=1 Tax=Mucilaginibacter sp. cycad4 TaxID=3342096 RepID=UPI002AAC2275|nr:MFS transporter [Mucilaginibacter gossypii]WPU99146.1 MFS transporter [Mucilaginibacter gossypii]
MTNRKTPSFASPDNTIKATSRWLALMVILTAPLLSVVDTFIINVAIPSIKTGLEASDGQLQLVIAGYLLGYASFLITGGRAGDHFGRKRVFFWGMFGFTLISCLCGLAQTPLELNLFRFFQGVSASFMMPQSIAFIQVLFTDHKERSTAIGYFGITLGLAATLGQVLGGYLSQLHTFVAGWRLIFFINLPIGSAALVATHALLPETKKNHEQLFDYSGVVILTASLFSLIIPLVEGREHGWPLWSIGLLLFSFVIFALFISDQRRKLRKKGNPLIDVTLFRNRQFNLGLIAVLFQYMAHTAYLLITALYFQNGIGYSSLQSGLFFALSGVTFTAASLIGSKLIPKYGKRIVQFGVTLMIIGFAVQIILFKSGVDVFVVYGLLAFYGFGNGFVLSSLLNITLRSVPQKFAGAAAGVYSTFQMTASALGVSIIGGIFFYIAELHPGHPDFNRAFVAGISSIIISLLLVWITLAVLPAVSNGNTEGNHLSE